MTRLSDYSRFTQFGAEHEGMGRQAQNTIRGARPVIDAQGFGSDSYSVSEQRPPGGICLAPVRRGGSVESCSHRTSVRLPIVSIALGRCADRAELPVRD